MSQNGLCDHVARIELSKALKESECGEERNITVYCPECGGFDLKKPKDKDVQQLIEENARRVKMIEDLRNQTFQHTAGGDERMGECQCPLCEALKNG
jgi:uncharacterized Zn finger protein (UPF0148 family)